MGCKPLVYHVPFLVPLVLLANLIVACANDPLPTTPVAGAPCGIAYVTCVEDGQPTGSCCDENNICCNGSTCPIGMCDYTGDNGQFAERRLTSQWKAGTKR